MLLSITLLLLAGPAHSDLLWRISSPARPEARVDVLATVAFSQQDRLAFQPEVLAAFQTGGRLVLPNDAALSPQNALIGWKAHLAEGDNLRNWLPPGVMARYVEAVGLAGYPPTFADVTAPWFAARMVRRADLERTGFAPEREFEVYFAHLAEERGVPIEVLPLEESATGYDRAAAIPRPVQVKLMEQALAESRTAAQDLPAALAAWKRGDARALAVAFPAVAAPEVARIAAAENERLADGIARLLAEPGAHRDLLLADARSLLGDDGLLEKLAARGLRVEAIGSATADGAAADPARAAAPYPAPPLAAVPKSPGTGRALLVGIDGATMRVIAPMLQAGRLPNLARLAQQGASGPLRSHAPLYSPRIWNSIATGKTPAHHGIEGFTFKDPSGVQRLYLSIHRKAHALWNIASAAKLSVGVVNWWNSYPPEVVNGVLVSDHAKPTRLKELRKLTGAEGLTGASGEAGNEDEEGATVYPPAWQDPVADVYARRLLVPGTDDPFLGNVGLADWMKKEELSKRFRDDAAVARIAHSIESTEAPDLMMVFLPGIDRVSHRLWAAIEPPEAYDPVPDMSPRQREAARDALEAYYAYSDALIGVLMEGYGKNDLVMVVSDHGFEAGEHLGALTGVHDSEAAVDGIVFARGPGIAPGTSTRGTSVNDVTPTILAWLGLPLGQDMQGRVAAFLTPRQPVTTIATHDVGEIERIGEAASGSEGEILDQLRALGYIE